MYDGENTLLMGRAFYDYEDEDETVKKPDSWGDIWDREVLALALLEEAEPWLDEMKPRDRETVIEHMALYIGSEWCEANLSRYPAWGGDLKAACNRLAREFVETGLARRLLARMALDGVFDEENEFFDWFWENFGDPDWIHHTNSTKMREETRF